LGQLSPTILKKDVDALMFDPLLVLWEELEQLKKWGKMMLEMRLDYADVIFECS